MSIAIISHPDCLLHGRDIDHPEQPARITAIEDQLKRSNLNNTLQHYQASMATREQLYRVHARRYVDLILDHLPSHQTIWLDPDTYCTADSGNAALRAAGANILGVDLVMNNRHDVAFCNIRPPGHHAVINHAMGFCLFNNIAVGTAHALEQYGLDRVAIIDFDVHHGNGTEAIFLHNDHVLLCSLFQHPFYPYSGAETTSDHIINIPVAEGTSGQPYRELFTSDCLPKILTFKPQLIMVSAGFDAHVEETLAGLCLTDDDYAWLGLQIKNIAKQCCNQRVILSLEGGYHLQALGRSVTSLLTAFI